MIRTYSRSCFKRSEIISKSCIIAKILVSGHLSTPHLIYQSKWFNCASIRRKLSLFRPLLYNSFMTGRTELQGISAPLWTRERVLNQMGSFIEWLSWMPRNRPPTKERLTGSQRTKQKENERERGEKMEKISNGLKHWWQGNRKLWNSPKGNMAWKEKNVYGHSPRMQLKRQRTSG